MKKIYKKLKFLAGTSAFVISSMYLQNAYSAEIIITTSDEAISSGDTIKFGTGATATVKATVADAIDIGDAGVVVTADTLNNAGIVEFAGSSIASGSIGAANNKVAKVLALGGSGKTVTLSGEVFAGSVELDSDGTVVLGDHLTGNIDFAGDGTVEIAAGKNITGNVTTDTFTQGTLTFTGTGSSIVSGVIGDITKDIKELNIDSANVTATGMVFSDAVNIGTGKLNLNDDFIGNIAFSGDGEVEVAGGKDIGGNVTADNFGEGTVAFAGAGSSDVLGSIGDSTNSIKEFNIADTTVAVTGGPVYSVTTDIGTGTLSLSGGDLTGNINFSGDGIVEVDDGNNINGSITTDTFDEGTLTFTGTGSSIVSGVIGDITNDIKELNVNNANVTATGMVFSNIINIGEGQLNLNDEFVADIAFSGDGTVTVAGGEDIGGNITTANLGEGTVAFTGTGSSDVLGTIGDVTNSIKEFDIADTTVTVTGGPVYSVTTDIGTGTLSLSGGDLTGNINFSGDGIVEVDDGNNINGLLSTATSGEGALTFTGSSASSVSGAIGVAGTSIKELNVDAAIVTASGEVHSDTINIGTGKLILNEDLTGNIDFAGDGTVEIASGKNITGDITVDNFTEGTLTFTGTDHSVVSGVIGALSSDIKELNVNNASVTATGMVFSSTVNIGEGQLNLNDEFVGNIAFSGDGLVEVTGGEDIGGNITTANLGEGTVAFTGAGSLAVLGTIGDVTNSIKELNITDTTVEVTGGPVYSESTDIGSGTLSLSGGDLTGNINFSGDGLVEVDDGNNINGLLSTANLSEGTLTFTGSSASSVSGAIGGGGTAIKELNIADAEVTTLGEVHSDTTNITAGKLVLSEDLTGNIAFAGDGIVEVSDGKNINGLLSTATSGEGALSFTGSSASSVSGAIGVAGTSIKELNVDAAIVTTSGEVHSDTINITTGKLILNEDLTGNIAFAGDGTVEIAGGKNIASDVITDNSGGGTLVFTGSGSSVVSGVIGDFTNAITELNINNADVTATGIVFSDTTNIGTGKLILNEDFIGNIGFSGDGTVELAGGKNITGDVTAANLGEGTVAFTGAGSSVVSGAIGEATKSIKEFNITDTTVTATGQVYSAITDIGTGKLSLNEGLTGNINFSGDGTVEVVDNRDIVGSIITDTDEKGNVVFLGTSIVSNNIGNSSNSLGGVTFSSLGDTADTYVLDVNADIYSKEFTIASDQDVLVNSDFGIFSDIIAGSDGEGKVIFDSATRVLDNNIGSSSARLSAVNFNPESKITSNKDIYANDIIFGSGSDINIASGVINASNNVSLNSNKITIPLNASATHLQTNDLTLEGHNEVTITFDGAVDTDVSYDLVKVDGSRLGLGDYEILSPESYFYSVSDNTVLGDDSIKVIVSKENSFSDLPTTLSSELAAALDEYLADPSGSPVTGELKLSFESAIVKSVDENAAIQNMQKLQPSVDGSSITTSTISHDISFYNIERRLSGLRSGVSSGSDLIGEGNSNVWGQVFINSTDQNKKDGIEGYETDMIGFSVGVDTEISDFMNLGVSFLYGDSESDSDIRSDNELTADNFLISIYGAHNFGETKNMYADAVVSLGIHNYESQRFVEGPEVKAHGDWEGISFNTRFKFGYEIPLQSGINFGTTASIRYAYLNQDDYVETGAGTANLTVKTANNSALEGGLGVKASYPVNYLGMKVNPELEFEVLYEFLGEENEVSSVYAGLPGEVFISKGAEPVDLSFRVGAGVSLYNNKDIEVSLDYVGTFASDYNSHTGLVKVNYAF